MTEIKLKPCPFCGGEAEFFEENNGYHSRGNAEWTLGIRCTKCGIKSPHIYRIDVILNKNAEFQFLLDERRVAVDDWNRRAGNG